MASRGLPGFLRRSLRIRYDENDDDDEAPVSETFPPDHGSYVSSSLDSSEVTNDNADDRDSTRPQPPSPLPPYPATPLDTTTSAEDSTTPMDRGIAHADYQGERQTPLSESNSDDLKHSLPSHSTKPAPSDSLTDVSQSEQELAARSESTPEDLSTPFTPTSYRDSQFDKVIHADVVSLATLRPLTWNGIPPPHRALAWKLLLGYVPTNASRRSHTLTRKRAEYREAIIQHYDIADQNTRTLQEQECLRQVLVDAPRTAPDIPLFRNDRIRRLLSRLLYVWAMRHPASSYVQGINDLATPLIVVFLADYCYRDQLNQDDDGPELTTDPLHTVLQGHVMNHVSDERLDDVEADVYGCLTNLLAGIQDHYTADQPGVQRMVMRVEELVRRIDVDLCKHLAAEGVQFLQFAFKWMNCLLLREFSLPCVVRLWDTYLSESNGFEDFHVYVCAALVCQFSASLQTMNFETLFAFLQELPTATWTDKEIEMLLSQAFVLGTLFGGSDAHLVQHG
jgi:hypothetical protein